MHQRTGTSYTKSSGHRPSPPERSVSRWLVPALMVFAFVCVLLGTAAGLALPIMFSANDGPSARVYATSTTLADAAPIPAQAASATVASDAAGETQDGKAEVVDTADAPPQLAADSQPDRQADVVAVAPAPAPATAAPSHQAAVVTASSAAAVPSKPNSKGTITVETFGYDFGDPPSGATYLADVRNIEAGTFLQSENGLMPSVIERVMATPAAQMWLITYQTEWLPNLKSGDLIAIGCSRGHHRSVALGVIISKDLQQRGYTVNLVNRDISKTW